MKEEQTINGLPKGWKKLRVDDVCVNIIGGGTPSTQKTEYWQGDIPWISSADIYGIKDLKPRRNISLEAVKNSAANILPKGGIIVVTRVGLGKLAVAPYDLCFSQDSQGLILKQDLISTEYALLVLHQEVQTFKHQSRGTTINGVTKKQLAELQIVLPPLEEQRQIVSKIEELLSELDKGIEELKIAQQQLKVYRQAVLKWAFEGKLTESWRKEFATSTFDDSIYWQKKNNNTYELGFETNNIPSDWIALPIGNIFDWSQRVSPSYAL